jgi:hypothetical protein
MNPKQCIKCLKEQDLSEFRRRVNKKTGKITFWGVCKDCDNKRRRLKRKENKETVYPVEFDIIGKLKHCLHYLLKNIPIPY